jgi:hypothetical protein
MVHTGPTIPASPTGKSAGSILERKVGVKIELHLEGKAAANPKSYALHLRLGAAYLSSDRYAEAEQTFHELVRAGDPLPTSGSRSTFSKTFRQARNVWPPTRLILFSATIACLRGTRSC